MAGSDHASPLIFVANLPGRGSVCQPVVSLPPDAASAQLTLGTYGKPAPELTLRFLAPAGRLVAEGHLAPGAHEGVISIPLRRVASTEGASEACLLVGGRTKVAVAGEGVPVSSFSEHVNGQPLGGRISLVYFRKGSESWWQLLPVLSERFGLGKASFFGSWLLALAALGLLGVWVVTIRLLARELSRTSSS